MIAYNLKKIDKKKEEIELLFIQRDLKATETKGKETYYKIKEMKGDQVSFIMKAV